MLIVYAQKNEYGGYSGIQESNFEIVPEGFLEFPSEKWDVFFPPDKKGFGFVDFEVDEDQIVDVIWNEEAYQAYLASLPEPEEPPEDPDPPASLEELQKELTETQARLDAATRSAAMLEDCVAEMAEIVYA